MPNTNRGEAHHRKAPCSFLNKNMLLHLPLPLMRPRCQLFPATINPPHAFRPPPQVSLSRTLPLSRGTWDKQGGERREKGKTRYKTGGYAVYCVTEERKYRATKSYPSTCRNPQNPKPPLGGNKLTLTKSDQVRQAGPVCVGGAREAREAREILSPLSRQ